MEIDLYNVGILISFISQLVSGGSYHPSRTTLTSSEEEYEHHRTRRPLPRIERVHEKTTEIEIQPLPIPTQTPQPPPRLPIGGEKGKQCPQGSDKSLRENKCFVFVATAKSFIDAQSYCEKQYGNLASIRSGFDNHLLADHGRERFKGQFFYIGANTINSDSETYKWLDDSLLKYSNWLLPVTTVDAQYNQCVAMNPLNRGKWSPIDCFRHLSFVCEIPMIDVD